MSSPALIRSPPPPANLVLRDVRLLDPRLGLDARHDVRVRVARSRSWASLATLRADAQAPAGAETGGG